MGEICEIFCCLCNPEFLKCICNADCCGKCIECPGQCISGTCSCLANCCRNLNCDFCSNFCTSCFTCSEKACSGVFDSSLCRSAEGNCLSIFNCNSFVGSFSENTQDCLNLWTGRVFDGIICWLYCCPNNCLTTVGYSRASYTNSRAIRQHQKHHKHNIANNNKTHVKNLNPIDSDFNLSLPASSSNNPQASPFPSNPMKS